MNAIKRREFLRASIASLAAAGLGSTVLAELTQDDTDELLAKTKDPGSDGKLERYKTTRYGSAYHFKQHGEER